MGRTVPKGSGVSASPGCQRRKVSGTTKAAVVDKLRDVHLQLDKGITPKAGYAHYTVRQSAQDWLSSGLEGRSAKTVTKNQNVLEPILAVIGARKLRELGYDVVLSARREAPLRAAAEELGARHIVADASDPDGFLAVVEPFLDSAARANRRSRNRPDGPSTSPQEVHSSAPH